jgi:hypothetical protein
MTLWEPAHGKRRRLASIKLRKILELGDMISSGK